MFDMCRILTLMIKMWIVVSHFGRNDSFHKENTKSFAQDKVRWVPKRHRCTVLTNNAYTFILKSVTTNVVP